MKVTVTFEYELDEKQKEKFEDIRSDEGEFEAFEFLEGLVKKDIDVAEVVETEYKE
ncbi:TPA: hypothetical protein ACLQU7_005232 [Bacillus tropicus]|uniref:hypothetical protein n=1 Tax=Bacillus tropicus TaxID=2026188 RepID=UPI0002D2C972|nr:hypothetical protein [Bacillus tropicus]AIY72834.1 hypothetical protein NT98_5880 [Bacillus cereus]AJI02686.1 hypothetical protein AQ16_5884 [Bacillus cereus G9241]QPS48227.1 hypothetical protein I6G54_01095 [Bacillus tropicus]